MNQQIFRLQLKNFLIIILAVLVFVLLALFYLYYTLAKPPGSGSYRTSELQPLFSIYGKSSKAEDLLKRPNDVAFDTSDNIFITDSENGRVFVFDPRGGFIRQVGKRGKGAGEFQVPMGVAVASDGRTFVTDKQLNKISIFDRNGVSVKDIPVAHPMKPTVEGDRLYVSTASGISIYSLDGRKLIEIGRKGKAVGEFDYPFGISVDTEQRVYVANLANLRVEALRNNGEVLWVRGQSPKNATSQERTFNLPAGIALSGDGYLYVVDSFKNQITALTKAGEIIASLGKQGNHEGEFNYPAGIAARGDGVFAVADKYNDRVQVIKITIRQKSGQR